ncbi:MAG: putative endolysin [Prokaryotic dsDNA virus sp.]|nr:MAG: putative endolysin [Prokaryotic dsDNA virus sp.]|tara:strand:+ start:7649 stop:8128 length:480 start_codon:yes stop_codon:yes gene_type:complete
MLDFKALIEQITEDEGYRQEVYKCTAGYDTVGIGFALKDLTFTPEESYAILLWQIQNGTITMGLEDSKLILAKKIASLHLSLAKRFDFYDNLPPMIQSVLLNMSYQLGSYGVSKFKKMLKAMEESDWKEASKEMLDSKWAKIDTPARANRLATIVREHG